MPPAANPETFEHHAAAQARCEYEQRARKRQFAFGSCRTPSAVVGYSGPTPSPRDHVQASPTDGEGRTARRVYEGSPLEVTGQGVRFASLCRLGTPSCSLEQWRREVREVTYKMFATVLGVELGKIQRFKDLKIDGPEVRKLIEAKERAGGKVDIEELIITPVAQFEGQNLELVKVFRP